MHYFKYKYSKNKCPLCNEGKECGFNFPSIKEFQVGGLFQNVTLPLQENQNLPKDLLNYIFPNNWNAEYDHVPFHGVYYVKKYLNTYNI